MLGILPQSSEPNVVKTLIFTMKYLVPLFHSYLKGVYLWLGVEFNTTSFKINIWCYIHNNIYNNDTRLDEIDQDVEGKNVYIKI